MNSIQMVLQMLQVTRLNLRFLVELLLSLIGGLLALRWVLNP
jgi:hypothetical protein